ncbi:MAG: hypothetical protein U0S12_00210 [Fimbriimonadales bacterium]
MESRDALSAVVGALAASGVAMTSLAMSKNNTVTANMGVTGPGRTTCSSDRPPPRCNPASKV